MKERESQKLESKKCTYNELFEQRLIGNKRKVLSRSKTENSNTNAELLQEKEI